MAQFARPDSDVTNTGTNGFAAIDEATRSDADFWWGDNNTVEELEVSLSDVTDPAVSTGHIFRYTYARTNAGTVDGAGNAVTVTARLMQGTTPIATPAAQTANGTWLQHNVTLSGAEADAITDYTDLRLEFVTSASGGSPANRRGGAVSWAELEVPDAAAATDVTLPLIDQSGVTFAPSLSSSLTLGLLDQSAVLFVPSLTADIDLTLLEQLGGVFAPTITEPGGTDDVTLPLLDQSSQVFAPALSSSLTLSLIDQTGVVFAPALTAVEALPLLQQLGVTFAPSLVEVTQLPLLDQSGQVFAPSLSASLAVPLLEQLGAVFAPQVTEPGAVPNITLPLLSQAGAVFAPTLSADVALPVLQQLGVVFDPVLVATVQLVLLERLGVVFALGISETGDVIVTGLVSAVIREAGGSSSRGSAGGQASRIIEVN